MEESLITLHSKHQELFEHFFPLVLDGLPSGILIFDNTCTLMYVNQTGKSFLVDMVGEVKPGVCWKNLDAVREFASVVDETLSTRCSVARREIVFELPETGEKVIGFSAAPLVTNENTLAVVVVLTDLTEVKRQEKASVLTKQLATLGELTAGVVHELRNPVSIISGLAELLLRKLGDSEEFRGVLETIYQEAVGLERSISQFLAFAKPYELQKRETEPREIVERALQFCQRKAQHKNVIISVQFQDELPKIKVDAERLAQALGNVVLNAVEAVGENGKIEVSVGTSGNEIIFEVMDNGPGIHIRPGESLFAPFFTQKEGGTGLGLTIAYRIVSAHEGSISYANRKSGGARFEIKIPM